LRAKARASSARKAASAPSSATRAATAMSIRGSAAASTRPTPARAAASSASGMTGSTSSIARARAPAGTDRCDPSLPARRRTLREARCASQLADRDAAPGPAGVGHGLLQRALYLGRRELVAVDLAVAAVFGEDIAGAERDLDLLAAERLGRHREYGHAG